MKLKSLFKFTLTLGLITWSQLSLAKEVVVLVPGFFNSFTPEYFSEAVVNSFKSKGFQVYVAKGLNPIGTIEDNGSRLESIFQQVEKLENKKVNFNIVAHSAGGFYAMWVSNRQKFSIKNILTVSTPYKGVEFVQAWLDRSYLFRTLTELAHLESLNELTPQGVKQFFSTIRVDPKTKIFSFGGYQNEGFDITDARQISIPLRLTSHFISEKSDGIVGFSSAMGIGEIKTTTQELAQQFKDDKYFLNLEHWEQVLDYRAFIILGIRNLSFIRDEQTRFYTGLAQFLMTHQ
jgi:hypothetical protein